MLHENLKALRKQKGLTQEELAIRLNVVRQTVSKWESGRSVPDADILLKIADVLDVSISDLLGAALPNDETQQNEIAAQLIRLNEQYAKYGYYTTCNRYFFCYDPAVLARIFRRLRAGRKYPTQVGRWRVVRVRDVTTGYDSAMPDGKCALPVTPGTEMITLYFDNGCVCTLRGSGTEPKLKYYIELHGDFAKRADIDAELREMVSVVPYETLQPVENGLTIPKD